MKGLKTLVYQSWRKGKVCVQVGVCVCVYFLCIYLCPVPRRLLRDTKPTDNQGRRNNEKKIYTMNPQYLVQIITFRFKGKFAMWKEWQVRREGLSFSLRRSTFFTPVLRVLYSIALNYFSFLHFVLLPPPFPLCSLPTSPLLNKSRNLLLNYYHHYPFFICFLNTILLLVS